MLKVDWNSLRVGDDVLVHDVPGTERTLTPGVVVVVETKKGKPGVNGVGIRAGHGDGHQVLWPPYLAVHRDPPDLTPPCWRCEAFAQAAVRCAGWADASPEVS